MVSGTHGLKIQNSTEISKKLDLIEMSKFASNSYSHNSEDTLTIIFITAYFRSFSVLSAMKAN